MAKHTSLRARFLGFAGGHFMLSALGVVGILLAAGSNLGGGEHLAQVWLLSALLLLLYLPIGALAARLMEWERPTVREWLRAVALTGGVACLWGFGGFVLCLTQYTALVGMLLLLSTFYLASPSFLFMLLVLLQLLGTAGSGWALLLWFSAIAAAALLPPVLFFTGTLLASKKRPEMGLDEGRVTS